jgi:RNA polymerase sigma factor (sigma-70 family)
MTSGQLSQVLRQLCRLVGARSVEELSDRQLLEAFAQSHDSGAFEILVMRHGPLVLGVCRRVLQEDNDADDAFQATFMVFARKAGTIRRQEAVASWLCGTAYRIALKAKAAAGRRREQERQAGQMSNTAVENDTLWKELRPILDEELNRLPAKYRVPLVLCYLQGKTNEAAARELGWAPGSMSYRLAQARDKLRTRLMQRGVALSAVSLAAVLADNATAAVQAPLLDATVQASVAYAAGEAAGLAGVSAKVLSLAEAGMQAIALNKVRLIAAIAVSLVLFVGGAGLVIKKVANTSTNGSNGQPNGTVSIVDARPRLAIDFSASHRFGLICPRLLDADGNPKRLTREAKGTTNNTCISIDEDELIYGIDIPSVRWVRDRTKHAEKNNPTLYKIGERAWQSAVEHVDKKIRVTQTIELIRGEQTGLYDTVLVKYQIKNSDTNPHTVGLRFMLDTLIGKNDGVPFLIPPTEQAPAHLVDTMAIFTKATMPDFIRALESEKLDDKNATVAELNVKLRGYEPLEKLVICRWPDNSEMRWKWQYQAMNEPANREKDSCVVLYWPQKEMKPNEERLLGFTYGLGQIYGEGSGGSADGGYGRDSGKLCLMTAGSSKIDRTFTATAYVKGDTLTGQKITLQLPPGLTLAEGQQAQQVVTKPGPQGYSQVSWRVRSNKVGKHTLEVELLGIKAQRDVKITEISMFD